MIRVSDKAGIFDAEWTIKEVLSIGFFSLLVCIFICFVMLRVFHGMPWLAQDFHSFALALFSIILLSICLIWLTVIKKKSLKIIGIANCKFRYYLYGP